MQSPKKDSALLLQNGPQDQDEDLFDIEAEEELVDIFFNELAAEVLRYSKNPKKMKKLRQKINKKEKDNDLMKND